MFKHSKQVGRGLIVWNQPAFRMVLDSRGNRLYCGPLADCLAYINQWEAMYDSEG